MNKIFSLLKLDFKLIKQYYIVILFLFLFGLGMSIAMQSKEIISSYILVTLIFTMSYPFISIDKNNINILYGTLAINRKIIVIGRYLFSFALAICGGLLSLLFTWIFTIIFNQEFILTETILLISYLFLIYSLFMSIQYPIYFKLGYIKGKSYSLISFVLVLIILLIIPLLIINKGWDKQLSDLVNYPIVTCLLVIIGGLVFQGISYLISYKLYLKKEF